MSSHRSAEPPSGAPPLAMRAPARLAAVVLALRRFLLRLADRLVPPPVGLFELATSGMASRAVRTAIRLGIPDRLASGPRTPEALADAVGVRADELHRVLRVCAGVGVFAFRRGRWRQTAKSKALLPHVPGSFRAPFEYFASEEIATAWSGIDDAVRTGRDGYAQRYGTTVWDWYEQNERERARFAASMAAITAIDARGIAATPAFRGLTRLCDAGGGRGLLLDTVLAAHPTLRGVLLESAGVLPLARTSFEATGRLDRVELVEGSFFEAVPAGCDGVLLKNILHDWDDTACATILGAVRRSVEPGARLIVVEMLLERGEVAGFAPRSDLHMLLATERGRERSRAELGALLAASGFALRRVHRLPGDQRVVEAVSV